MDEDSLMKIVGLLIVIVVALNILLMFGDLFNIGGGLQKISGFAVADCKNTVGGISCGGNFYNVKPQSENCSEDKFAVCTNVCEIEKIRNADGRVCPTQCTEFCVPPTLAEKLMQIN